jgi:hypothetical protein
VLAIIFGKHTNHLVGIKRLLAITVGNQPIARLGDEEFVYSQEITGLEVSATLVRNER